MIAKLRARRFVAEAKRIHAVLRQRPVRSLLVACLFTGTFYVVYLDWHVTHTFEERRWNLPAQVYAQPLELYVNLKLDPERLELELKRLGYRQSEDLVQPGRFRQRSNAIDIYTRPFRFWDGYQGSRILRVAFDSGRVDSLSDGGGNIPVLRLDPLPIGSVFPGHGEDRQIVEPGNVPPLLMATLKIVEDRRFERHHGIDPAAIVRAMIANLHAGEITQGGSTLTQQLVRSYFLDNRQTLGRKLREAVMSVFLEMRFDKSEILNAYVNEIYLGQDGPRAIHGFGLASQFYFGKPIGELEVHEIALLVAILRGPSYYDPRQFPERALERRNRVLRLMAEFEIVAADESLRAIERNLGITERSPLTAGYYPAFMDLVRRQLRTDYLEEDLTTDGLRIFTTLNPLVQATAETRLADGLEELQDGPEYGHPRPQLEGALVIASVQSAEVLAVVGGRRTAYDGFNRALDAKRQVGSLIKPAVYLAALESGRYDLTSRIDDAETEIELENGDLWRPHNLGGELHGSVPLLRALSESYNLATVRLGMDIGVTNVADTLHRLGIAEPPKPFPSLLLGALDLSPIEVAQMYNSLANGGFKMPLRSVNVVVDAQGEPLQRYPIEITRAADPAAVFQLNQALMTAMDRGTGSSAAAVLPPGYITAGKTGTSDDWRDSWFAGFTGDHVAVVWVGNDDNLPTGLTGASGALQIWSRVVRDLDSAPLQLTPGPELRPVWLEYETGLQVGRRCRDSVRLDLPDDAELQRAPSCGFDPALAGQRALDWLQGLVN